MSDIVNEVLAARYFREGESSWEDVCRRVADYVGNTDDEREIYYDMMVNKDFVPNSPTLMNAGTSIGQLSACFVLPIYDSMESIFDAIKNAALIHKAAGGTGFSFGNLRPEGDKVNGTDGVASGPISFMKVFNAATDAVKQGSKRRGANMGVLPVWHPDIEKFITCKNTEGELSNFNISVMIDDEFINAVKNDKEYNLHFDGRTYKTVRAKDLFEKIIDGISKTGEPGVLFYDYINNANTCKHLGNIEATNPCLHGDTLIHTINGIEKIKNKEFAKVFNGDKYTNVKIWKSGSKQTIKLTTNSGFEFIVTPEHKFMLSDGTWEESQNLLNKQIKFENRECEWVGKKLEQDINYEILGFELGDGSWHKDSGRMKYIFITPEKDDEVKEIIEKEFNDKFYYMGTRLCITIKKDTVYANIFENIINKRDIPDEIMCLPKNEMKQFIRGIFSANGCNLKKYKKIQLVSINKNMLKQIQSMLMLFGIKAKLWVHNKKHTVKFSNGDYECKETYHLVISRKSYKKYVDEIGFIQTYKNGRLDCNYNDEDDYETVVSIEDYKECDVYDFNEPLNKYMWCNGIFLHNCAEEPLLPYESCNLGSINLSNFIDNNDKLNISKLINTIELSTEFLDKIIDLNKYPIEEIAEASRKTRKIGLGYMGFHHMLMKMGIPYDSSDALYWAKKVMSILDASSVAASCELAKELGTFPAYEGSQWFLQDIPMRNATTTCIAPTGSIATLSETSYGIEPVFSLVHKRYTWVDGEKKGYLMVDPVFEEKLDEYIETHYEFSQWDKKKQEVINHAYETGTIQDITWLPVEFKSVFKTALDIDWKAHIDMQAAFQQYCHAAISKTINMPSGATKDDIRSAILYAYEKKCKGVTIYVTGSRNDIVMELKKESTSTPVTTLPDGRILPKRPADLPATNSKRRSGCGKLIISVAEKDAKPYECIINNKGGCTAMNDALGQMISLSMRWNVPTWDIIKTLRNVTCPVAYKKFTEGKCDGKSCADVVGRVIESLIPDKDLEPIFIPRKEEIKTESNICPECGEKMSMVEGCVTCACGYSRCG